METLQATMSALTMKMRTFSVAVGQESPQSTSSSAVLQRDVCPDLQDLLLQQSPIY
jgi:hypothetical protein